MKGKLPHDHGEHRHLAQTMAQLEKKESFRITADLFKRLGDTTRLQIFWFLYQYEECVVNIAAALDMSSPAVSHHLRLLKEDGLIESRRDGKEVYYKARETQQCLLLHQMISQIMQVSFDTLESEIEQKIDQSPADKDYHAQQLEIIHRIHDHLTVHMDQHCTVESLAKQFLINTTTLKVLFKEEYGNSVAAHIREHRMEKAARMLADSQASLGEIAMTVGYRSQSKFTAAFKAYYHMLPKDYRQMYQKKG